MDSMAHVLGTVVSLNPLRIRERSGRELVVESDDMPDLKEGEGVTLSCVLAQNGSPNSYALRLDHVVRS